MKYLLPESDAYKVIYEYLDKEFGYDNLVVHDGFDYDGEQYVDDLKWFYFKQYEGDVVFMEYVKSEYYDKFWRDDEFRIKWQNKTPILEMRGDDMQLINWLNNFFGEFWKPIFEDWFRNNFPEYPVKTFIYP